MHSEMEMERRNKLHEGGKGDGMQIEGKKRKEVEVMWKGGGMEALSMGHYRRREGGGGREQ